MSVTLTNTTRRIKVIHLPHDVYCAALGTCACHALPGRPGRRDHSSPRVASSLTIPAGATSRELPDAILELPAVQRDIRAGALCAHRAPAVHTNHSDQPPQPQEPAPSRPRRRSTRRSRGDSQ